MSDSDFTLEEGDDSGSEWQRWIDLHRELKILTDPDSRKVILSPDSRAASLFLQVLKENEDWLASGIFADSRGRSFDLIEVLLDPETLGDLKHLYKSGRIFAIVRKMGSISDFIVLDHSLKLQLDCSDKSSRRLRLFVREIGMLILGEHDIRHLVVHDQRLS
jgi:hypothetical protein